MIENIVNDFTFIYPRSRSMLLAEPPVILPISQVQKRPKDTTIFAVITITAAQLRHSATINHTKGLMLSKSLTYGCYDMSKTGWSVQYCGKTSACISNRIVVNI